MFILGTKDSAALLAAIHSTQNQSFSVVYFPGYKLGQATLPNSTERRHPLSLDLWSEATLLGLRPATALAPSLSAPQLERLVYIRTSLDQQLHHAVLLS